MRRPRRLVLDHHQPLQHGQVLRDREATQLAIRAAGIGRQRRDRDLCGDVAGHRAHQRLDLGWIAPCATHSSDIDRACLVQVVDRRLRRSANRRSMLSRPSPDRDQLRQARHRHPRIGSSNRHPCEHLGEADLPGGMTGLGERHGPHAKKREPPRSRVAIDVIGRHRGTCENELTSCLTLVDSPANVVPDRGFDLPLVQQPRNWTVEHQRRIDTGRSERLRVDVEQHLAARLPLGGLGLATRLGTLDDHRARGIESAPQLIIDNSRQVAHPVSLPNDEWADRPPPLYMSYPLDYPLCTAMADRFVLRTLRHCHPTRGGKGRATQVNTGHSRSPTVTRKPILTRDATL